MNILITECKRCNRFLKTAGPNVHCKREGFNVTRKIIKIHEIKFVDCDIKEENKNARKNTNNGRRSRTLGCFEPNYKPQATE